MKKLLVLIVTILIVLTGCGGNFNSTPEKVALEMVDRLSNGDYDDIEELIYVGENNAYFTEETFKEYLKDNNLLIEGNKETEVVDYEEPEENVTQSDLVVKLDNERAIQFSLIKVEESWYVNLSSDINGEIEFLVPQGAKVKLDGKELDRKKYSEEYNASFAVSYSFEDAHAKMDKYTFNTFYNSKFELVVTKDGFKDYKETITEGDITNRDNTGIREDYYYFINLRPDDKRTKEVESFVKTYFDGLFDSINNNKDVSEVKKYYSYDLFEKIQKDYKYKTDALLNENSYSREKDYDYKYKKVVYFEDGIYYVGDDCVIVVGNVEYSYHHFFQYFGMMESFDDGNNDTVKEVSKKMALIMKKENDTYKITGGIHMIP